MKILKYFVIVLFVLGVGYLLITQKDAKTVESPSVKEGIELCFAKFGPKEASGFYDKFTLRLKMSGENREVAEGELRLLPAEKDALVGKFTGVVSPVDRQAMARTADLWWDAEGEGSSNKQQLRIVFGEGTASIGLGEMVDRGDGVYEYKDLSKVDYSFSLTDVSCTDLSERENVEEYLSGNIKTLSPVAPVLGGSWYVVSMDLDLAQNSGTVIYEDGHIQEKRGFTYEVSPSGEILKIEIK